jgi:hypothetical protein
MKKPLTLVLIGSFLGHSSALAYDVPNHGDMSAEAVVRSELVRDPSALANMGLKGLDQTFPATQGEDSREFTAPCMHATNLSITNLIRCGAQFEDVPDARSLNHFYDPINNGPLKVRIPPLIGPLVTPGMTSPDWALQDNQNNIDSAQLFSYKQARDYFYQALTTAGPQQDREGFWGKLFQTIGQVIHHLQDMAQPQHVRNDAHCPYGGCALLGQYNPSLYERYTQEHRLDVLSIISGSNVDPIYSSGNPGAFKNPRDFWINASSTGIAEYTNKNFFSAGTLFRLYQEQPVPGAPYALPVPVTRTDVPVGQLTPPAPQDTLTYCGNAIGPACTMTFYSTNDGNPASFNPRAASVSIFDQYVTQRPVTYVDPMQATEYQVDRIPALNQYNFISTHPLLIPRTVAYSAGLINYFFRGKLEISLPDEGVYAVVDHAIAAGNDPSSGGFDKVKLKLQNTTPGGTDANGNPLVEQMDVSGTGEAMLVAIAKFHRNNCYNANLSGEYGSQNVDGSSINNWTQCRSGTEEIVISNPVTAIPQEINSSAQPITFDFSANKIPELAPANWTGR